MKIEIFASKEKKPDFLSKVIMKRLGCDYSHVGVILDGVIYHAVGEGVCTANLEEFLKERTFSELFDVSDKIKVSSDLLKGWLEGRLGTEYSTSQYLGFAFPELREHISNGSEKVVCSELAYEFAVKAGLLPEGHFPNPDYVDPKMVIEALKESK